MDSLNDWALISDTLPTDTEGIMRNGTKFQQANGYMGYRGTLDEYRAGQCVGITLAGIYDQVGDAWREPVNAPNGAYTQVLVNGVAAHALEREVVSHRQSMGLRNAVFERDTTLKIGNVQVRLESRRFLSLADPNLLCVEYSVQCDQDCELEILTGIDYTIWDLNGPHLESFACEARDGIHCLSATTHEQRKTVVVAECLAHDLGIEKESRAGGMFARSLQLQIQAGKRVTFRKFVSVFKSGDCEDQDLLAEASTCVAQACTFGFESCLKKHEEVWNQRWAAVDVQIEGDDEAQFALRYSLLQLLMVAPVSGSANSIPARALSGQVYKGAIFWDTEFFMFPFFLHALPEVAEDLLRYRIRTLDGARRKAAIEGTGNPGAFYAWESQDTGDEGCTYFNVGDPFTKRDLRTYFRDKQIHISGDIALAFWEYFQHTGSDSLLREGGAEVIIECARFYASYLYYKPGKDRYEVLDVVGPDEYHERVNNNAFTNRIVQATLQVARLVIDHFEQADPALLQALERKTGYRETLGSLDQIIEKLYIPAPDSETGIIEQFDGYYKLEEISLDALKKRILLPNEYLGAGQGVAAHTQIIKQADVVMMLNRFRSQFPANIRKSNWEYYEPRTEHGSSLSACAYAIVAASCGKVDWAYRYFMKTARVDLEAKYKMYAGTTFIGGSHPAASGGAWMAVVFGFAGLEASDEVIQLNPRLPVGWESLRFRFRQRGGAYTVTIKPAQILIEAASSNIGSTIFRVGDQSHTVAPGSTLEVSNSATSR